MGVRLQDYDDKSARMQALMALPKAPYIADAQQSFDPATAAAVEMHDGGVTVPNAAYPAVGTVALTTCIGVFAHNPQTKATGLVHVVSDGAEEHPSPASQMSLEQMLNSVQGDTDHSIEVRIVGAHIGGALQDGILNHIADLLSEYDAHVLSADVKGKPGPKDVAVDSSRWDAGLIRGGADMVDFLHDPDTGGVGEMMIQRKQCVDLSDMTWFSVKSNALAYDATKDQNPHPEPEI